MLQTYCVEAEYRFDWLHFLVRAESFEEARSRVEESFYWNNDYDYIRGVVDSGVTDFVDFCVDEDENDYGRQYFEVWEWPGSVDILEKNEEGKYLERVKYPTLEEAKKALNPNKKYRLVKYRGFTFEEV